MDIFRRFLCFYYCACAEAPLILLPVSKWTSNSDFPCRKTYPRGKLSLKTVFKDIFRRFLCFYYCACAETPLILLPVSKWTSNSDSPCRKTYISWEMLPKIRHFDPFLFDFTMRQRALDFWLLISCFPPNLGVKIFFLQILTPQRHFLTPKHVLWLINGPNRFRGLTCADEQEPPPKKKKKLKRDIAWQCWGSLGESR